MNESVEPGSGLPRTPFSRYFQGPYGELYKAVWVKPSWVNVGHWDPLKETWIFLGVNPSVYEVETYKEV